MGKKLVQAAMVWSIFCTALTGCGRASSAKTLQVELQLPQGEAPAAFWLGVETKTLFVKSPDGEERGSVPWEQAADLDIHQGDTVSFEGRDADDELVVQGEATAGEENTLLVPVERVL